MSERIVYAARRFISGLTDVKLNLWDPDGTQVVTDTVMAERGSTGIYYYDYTPAKRGVFTGYADSLSHPSKVLVTLDIVSLTTSSASSSTSYCTTLQVLQFLDVVEDIPGFVEGSSSAEELVGVGTGSATTFYLNHNRVVAGSYTFSYGASEAAATDLTETTHYTIDKDAGKLTLTATGLSLVSTNNIYAAYKWSLVPDSVVADAVERASRWIDKHTSSSFTTNTETDEYHDGKGGFEYNYFIKHLPVISITALSTTQNSDETASASTTWDSLTENDHFYTDLETGRASITYSSYRPVRGRNRLKVTYVWGHAAVPVAIERECVRVAALELLEGTQFGGFLNAKRTRDDTASLGFTISDVKKNLGHFKNTKVYST